MASNPTKLPTAAVACPWSRPAADEWVGMFGSSWSRSGSPFGAVMGPPALTGAFGKFWLYSHLIRHVERNSKYTPQRKPGKQKECMGGQANLLRAIAQRWSGHDAEGIAQSYSPSEPCHAQYTGHVHGLNQRTCWNRNSAARCLTQPFHKKAKRSNPLVIGRLSRTIGQVAVADGRQKAGV